MQNVRFTYLALALHILTDASVLSTCAALGCSLFLFPSCELAVSGTRDHGAGERFCYSADGNAPSENVLSLSCLCLHLLPCPAASSSDAGAIWIEGLEHTICLLEKRGQQSSLLVSYSIVCIYVCPYMSISSPITLF